MKNQHCMVVGASGRIGRRLCRALRSHDMQVTGVARFRDKQVRASLEAEGVQTHPFDVLQDDPTTLPEVDIVFLTLWNPADHTASDAAERIWALNHDAICRLVARYAGRAHFMNGCTGNVYHPSPYPSRETDPLRPVTDYGLSRMAQEKTINLLCKYHGSKVIHLRYYHANDTQAGMLRRVAQAVYAGEPISGGPAQRIQVIAIEDFIHYTLLAAERIEKQDQTHWEVNICHPKIWTMHELATRLQRTMNCGSIRFKQPQNGDEASYIGDTTRMIESFGSPTESIDGLIEQVAYAVANT